MVAQDTVGWPPPECERAPVWGGVEISDQVVDQIYMGVRGGCWRVGGEMVNLGEYMVLSLIHI